MGIDTLLRRAEHQALGAITLTGDVLDLGGDARASYRTVLKGAPAYTTVNLDLQTRPDIVHDLEKRLPVESESYDHALLMNVLEHVYNYRGLFTEAVRVVKPGGSVIVVVPFLFPIHPSPNDYWRFSRQALLRECEAQQLEEIMIRPLGSGVFSARYLLLDRLLPAPLRMLGAYTFRPIALILDVLFTKLAHFLHKAYDPADYALGYCVVAKKP